MTVTHVGSTKKYSTSWENIFQGKRGRSAAKPAAGKKTAKAPKKSARAKAKKR